MGRLLQYCEEQLAAARTGKERAVGYLAMVKRNIEIGEPVGPMQYMYSEKDIKKAKNFIEEWDSEVKVWEAERALL